MCCSSRVMQEIAVNSTFTPLHSRQYLLLLSFPFSGVVQRIEKRLISSTLAKERKEMNNTGKKGMERLRKEKCSILWNKEGGLLLVVTLRHVASRCFVMSHQADDEYASSLRHFVLCCVVLCCALLLCRSERFPYRTTCARLKNHHYVGKQC